MIAVSLTLDAGGNFRSVEASGHAGAGVRGEDIVCSAVTALLRTTLTALSGELPGMEAESAGRGALSFRAPVAGEGASPFLRYAGLFLREGLSAIAREYPGSVDLTVVGGEEPARKQVILED